MINTIYSLTSSAYNMAYQGAQSGWKFAIRNPKLVLSLALMALLITPTMAGKLIINQAEGRLTLLPETEETTILCFHLNDFGDFAYRMLATRIDYASEHLEILNDLLGCGLENPRNLAKIIPVKECLEKGIGRLFSMGNQVCPLVEAVGFEQFCIAPQTHSGL